MNRTEFLVYARRLHDALRHAIEDGDGRTDDRWLHEERPLFEHYACGIYLAGCLSFLEGKYGERPWNKHGASQTNFDSFLQSLPEQQRNNFTNYGINKDGLNALVCIRNAVTHNDNDLARNRDASYIANVQNASITGVNLNGTIISLSSSYTSDFMEYVRKSLVAVSMYHGDG